MSIETLTKAVESNALVTRKIAENEPGAWHSIGQHRLAGVSQEIELFEMTPETATLAADAIGAEAEHPVETNGPPVRH